MIVELLVTLLTPIATYNILRAFNVPKPPAIIISLIYTTLLFAEFTWIITIYGMLTILLLTVLVAALISRSGHRA